MVKSSAGGSASATTGRRSDCVFTRQSHWTQQQLAVYFNRALRDRRINSFLNQGSPRNSAIKWRVRFSQQDLRLIAGRCGVSVSAVLPLYVSWNNLRVTHREATWQQFRRKLKRERQRHAKRTKSAAVHSPEK